ncbi:MAG: hypothetical protein R3254_00125, partial [Thiomicrorhabdus sp.]|nr:hypothetical protein [Thiomicrorhabdus sp.]
YRLGSKYGQECTDTIEVLGGQIAQWPRWGLNTRFGLYKRPEHRNEHFPSAPNVVDYPHDDNLTFNDGGECGSSSERFGNGHWNVTECHPNPTHDDQQPSTFSRVDYNTSYHDGSVVPNMNSRLEYYNWEVSIAGSLPDNNMSASDIHTDEQQCNPAQDKPCRMLDGDPNSLSPAPDTIDYDDLYKRRELFVGLVACNALNVKANSVLNVQQLGVKWARFFLTEHVSPPSGSEGVTIYSEFIELVGDDDDEHFKKVIQLYE